MMNDRDPQRASFQALRSLLEAVPSVARVGSFRRQRGRSGTTIAGLVVQFKRGGRVRWIVDERTLPLKPRAAELAAFEYQQYVMEGFGDYAVVLAPYVSPRSAEILARAGVGFFDLSGNCRLVSGPLFIERTGLPNAFARNPGLRSLFTPGSERVLRAALDPAQQRRAWTVRQLAEAAYPGVSVGQAHRVATLMEEQAFLQRGEAGLELREPEKLLGAWAEHYRFERSAATRFYSPLGVPELHERLAVANQRDKAGALGVLASFSAAEVLAPFVRQHRFFVYRRGDRARLVRELELKPISSGENVVVLEPYDEGVFYPGPKAHMPVTCPLQTYLDLKASPARGEEAAQAVFAKYLRKAYDR